MPSRWKNYMLEQNNPNHVILHRYSHLDKMRVSLVLRKGCDICDAVNKYAESKLKGIGYQVQKIKKDDDSTDCHLVYNHGRLISGEQFVIKVVKPGKSKSKSKDKDKDKNAESKSSSKPKNRTKLKPVKPSQVPGIMTNILMASGETDGMEPVVQQRRLMARYETRDWTERRHPMWHMLVWWAMGCGKTQGLLRALTANSKMPPPKRVIIVCPNTMIEYWLDNILALPQPRGTATEFQVLGFTEFAKQVHERGESWCRGAVVAIDECAYYRNMQVNMLASMSAARQANELFLLTGTPIMNDPAEMRYLAFFGAAWLSAEQVLNMDVDALSRVIKKCYNYSTMDAFNPVLDDAKMASQCFPAKTVEIRRVPMSWRQTLEYFRMMTQTVEIGSLHYTHGFRNSYNSLTRPICNSLKDDDEPVSNKMRAVYDDVLANYRKMKKEVEATREAAKAKAKSKKTSKQQQQQQHGAMDQFDDSGAHVSDSYGAPLPGLSSQVMLGDFLNQFVAMNASMQSKVENNGEWKASTTSEGKQEKKKEKTREPKPTRMRAQVIHSHFIELGCEKLKKMLEKSKYELRVALIDGATPTQLRQSIVKKFNAGKLDVLILSDAAAIGTDLKHTLVGHLLEEHVNLALENQTIARFCRMKSHKRGETVHVVKWKSVFPDGSAPVDKDDRERAQKCFVKMGADPKEDVIQALWAKIKETSEGTVEEQMERDNLEKDRKIQPVLQFLRECFAQQG